MRITPGWRAQWPRATWDACSGTIPLALAEVFLCTAINQSHSLPRCLRMQSPALPCHAGPACEVRSSERDTDADNNDTGDGYAALPTGMIKYPSRMSPYSCEVAMSQAHEIAIHFDEWVASQRMRVLDREEALQRRVAVTGWHTLVHTMLSVARSRHRASAARRLPNAGKQCAELEPLRCDMTCVAQRSV